MGQPEGGEPGQRQGDGGDHQAPLARRPSARAGQGGRHARGGCCRTARHSGAAGASSRRRGPRGRAPGSDGADPDRPGSAGRGWEALVRPSFASCVWRIGRPAAIGDERVHQIGRVADAGVEQAPQLSIGAQRFHRIALRAADDHLARLGVDLPRDQLGLPGGLLHHDARELREIDEASWWPR